MFEFLPALIGGMMIGAAAVLLMATHGQIMGISGMLRRVLPPLSEDWQWRLMFLLGVLVAPVVYAVFVGAMPAVSLSTSIPLVSIAGLLVGFGAITGNGCTSGQGVCGLPRISGRSFVAVGVFMSTAFLTGFATRHLSGV